MKKQKSEKYTGHRKTGILLTEDILPDMKALSSEQEQLVLYAYHMFDKAHLVMLAEKEFIPNKDVSLMLKALREMEKSGIEKVRLDAGGGMHSGEYYLIRQLGEEIGGKIHLASAHP
ncbi:MAG: hypothetical protein JRC68_07100 [Deltaproteobacteria bacterium]|nr:hypothetical protein [Deltaproteobacteria bacterium]